MRRSISISLISCILISLFSLSAHAQFIRLGPTGKQVTGVLGAVNGGTDQSVYALGDILYASGTTALSVLNVGSADSFLQGGTTPHYGTFLLCGDSTHALGYDTVTHALTCQAIASGVTSVSGTDPIVSSGGSTPAISCPTCVTGGVSSTTVGGIVGAFYNTNGAGTAILFYNAASTTGRTPAPFTMQLGGLSVCISATQNANSLQDMIWEKLNAAGTADTFDLTRTIVLPGAAAGCYQQTLTKFPVQQGEAVSAVNANIGTTQSLLGIAANIYGSTSQWLGNFINASTVALSTTVYTGPGQLAVLTTTVETQAAIPVTYASTAKNLCIRTNSTQSATGSLVLTLFDNGVATGVTVAIPLSGVAGVRCDFVNTASITAGHWISWELANNATAASAQINSISMELVPSGNATALILFPKKGQPLSASVNNYFPPHASSGRSATETDQWGPIPRAGNLKNLSCFVTTAPTNTVTVTIQVNGTPSAATGTFDSGVSTAAVTSIWTGTLAIAANDAVTINYATGAATQAVVSSCSAEFD